MFPRLRGEVDEFGNPKASGGAPDEEQPYRDAREFKESEQLKPWNQSAAEWKKQRADVDARAAEVNEATSKADKARNPDWREAKKAELTAKMPSDWKGTTDEWLAKKENADQLGTFVRASKGKTSIAEGATYSTYEPSTRGSNDVGKYGDKYAKIQPPTTREPVQELISTKAKEQYRAEEEAFEERHAREVSRILAKNNNMTPEEAEELASENEKELIPNPSSLLDKTKKYDNITDLSNHSLVKVADKNSVYSRAVRKVLKEKGVPYENEEQYDLTRDVMAKFNEEITKNRAKWDERIQQGDISKRVMGWLKKTAESTAVDWQKGGYNTGEELPSGKPRFAQPSPLPEDVTEELTPEKSRQETKAYREADAEYRAEHPEDVEFLDALKTAKVHGSGKFIEELGMSDTEAKSIADKLEIQPHEVFKRWSNYKAIIQSKSSDILRASTASTALPPHTGYDPITGRGVRTGEFQNIGKPNDEGAPELIPSRKTQPTSSQDVGDATKTRKSYTNARGQAELIQPENVPNARRVIPPGEQPVEPIIESSRRPSTVPPRYSKLFEEASGVATRGPEGKPAIYPQPKVIGSTSEPISKLAGSKGVEEASPLLIPRETTGAGTLHMQNPPERVGYPSIRTPRGGTAAPTLIPENVGVDKFGNATGVERKFTPQGTVVEPIKFPKEFEEHNYRTADQAVGKDVPTGLAEAEHRLQVANEAYRDNKYGNARKAAIKEREAAQAALDALRHTEQARGTAPVKNTLMTGKLQGGWTPALDENNDLIKLNEEDTAASRARGKNLTLAVEYAKQDLKDADARVADRKVGAIADQRAAKAALAKAQSDVQRVSPPSASGGSQGVGDWSDITSNHLEDKPAPREIAQPWHDVTAEPITERSASDIAKQYLKELEGQGIKGGKVENLIKQEPSAAETLEDVNQTAKRFGVDLISKKGFENPAVKLVDDASSGGSKEQRPMGIGKVQQGSAQYSGGDLIPEQTVDTESNRILAKREGDANRQARAPEEAKYDQLQKIRERLGITKHAESRAGSPETIGNQKPIFKADEKLSTRATSQSKYFVSEPKTVNRIDADGNLEEVKGVEHSVKVSGPTGKPLGLVRAIEYEDEPNTLRVIESESKAQPGTHLVRDKGYGTLLDRAQRLSTDRNTEVTVRSDKAKLMSPSAIATWKGLKESGYDVKTAKDGGSSVTFKSRKSATSLPRAMGGEEAPDNTTFMGSMRKYMK
jgi:hypothetical protein